MKKSMNIAVTVFALTVGTFLIFTPFLPPAEPSPTSDCALYAHDACPYVQSLLNSTEGFGKSATGGLNGEVYRVTNLNDNGPGSLREALESEAPLWIVFDVSGRIFLETDIRISPHKTIDGRGSQITIRLNGLVLHETDNVIVHNIRFLGGVVDAIGITNSSKNIFIDHCSFANYDDGLLDIKRGSTLITASWNRFYNHDKTSVIGLPKVYSPPEIEKTMEVTLHHNYFNGVKQRAPRACQTKVHTYNNYHKNWGLYAIGSAEQAQVLAENNYFEAGSKKEAVTCQFEGGGGYVKAKNNYLVNGATLTVCNPNAVAFALNYDYNLWPANTTLRDEIKLHAGWEEIGHPQFGWVQPSAPENDILVASTVTDAGPAPGGFRYYYLKAFISSNNGTSSVRSVYASIGEIEDYKFPMKYYKTDPNGTVRYSVTVKKSNICTTIRYKVTYTDAWGKARVLKYVVPFSKIEPFCER